MRALLTIIIFAMSALPAMADYLSRPFTDDILYFLVLDRFAKQEGDGAGLPAVDPANPRLFHGGNLRAATGRLDYIKALGATAIWMTPIFVNQEMSEDHGKYPPSAGYHGYWILDFLHVDPHFGSEEDLRRFITEAHKRDIKVFFDIVVNHTADVIRYRECAGGDCPYRDKADFPYSRRAADGAAINPGFLGDDADHQSAANFARLVDPAYAYTPYVPAGREHAKTPDWLNDVRLYHNRGRSTFKGESALYGDFGGLDDVFTENPRVVDGFIDIYRYWIAAFHIDGYRIDTARHVNVEFWQKFNPAILDFAHAQGIPNFFIFGEVADFTDDSVQLARFTREAAFPGTLDFAFYDIVAKILAGALPAADYARIFQADSLYAGGAAGAASQPLFVSNHDDGRLAYLIRKANPQMPADELRARVILGHALMMFSRGVPVLYYGDEQGFIGSGNDAMARQDMFASSVPAFRDEERLGPQEPAAADHFDQSHPLFRAVAAMAALRRDHAALSHGRFLIRPLAAAPEVIAVSRLTGDEEVLVAVNTAGQRRDGAIEVAAGATDWQSLHGDCAARDMAPGSYGLSLAPLDYVVCRHALAPR